ncbi:DUF3265 domain-containing protein [Vibrio parahaemolyticus]|nr:DUF3265 domain-containing protein [Vibrio parahaemolyticus]
MVCNALGTISRYYCVHIESSEGKICLTNCLRVIRNAWHFYHALGLVVKVVCGSLSIALLTP